MNVAEACRPLLSRASGKQQQDIHLRFNMRDRGWKASLAVRVNPAQGVASHRSASRLPTTQESEKR